MRHKLEDIEAFVEVVEAGSITEAARRLSLAKSVISKRVADLENRLEASLLHRSTRRVQPTDKGAVFYERARAILADLDRAAEAVTDDGDSLVGALRIALPMSLGVLHLAPMLLDFAAAHPRLELALDLNDRMVDIAGDGFDLAIRGGQLNDSALRARRLATVRRVVAASPAYLDRAGRPDSLDDLSGHRAIGYANTGATTLWQFDPENGRGAPISMPLACTMVVNNGEVIRDAAIAGLGLCVLPTFLVGDAIADGRLEMVLPGVRPTSHGLFALYAPARHVPRAVRAIIDHLVDRIGEPTPWDRRLQEATGWDPGPA